MFLNCRPGCPNITTTASLDLDLDDVICNKCGEVIENVSSFTKRTLKASGDIYKPNNKKAFSFKCLSCNKDMPTLFKDNKICGKDCATKNKCKFNISKLMIRTISLFNIEQEENEELGENSDE